MTGTDPDPSIFRFFTEIGIIEQLARNRVERRLPHGLKLSQFSALNHFVRLEREESPLQLAKAFQVTKGTMTNTIQRLEALGFVVVRPDPDDGRGKRVGITGAGRAAHRESLDALGPDLSFIESELGGERFEQVLPMLEKVRVFLDQNRG
jgi:DNA-binding MarR family transcriptional regulator